MRGCFDKDINTQQSTFNKGDLYLMSALRVHIYLRFKYQREVEEKNGIEIFCMDGSLI